MSVKSRIEELKYTLPEQVTLVAVSKTCPIEQIKEAYDAGQRIFGESRPQEISSKSAILPRDIEWHFIGTLQTKQIKYYAPYVALIQSVDTEKALQIIQKEALKNNRVIDVLLEVHIAKEQTKKGWSAEELEKYLSRGEFRNLPNVRIRGLMGMATNTGDDLQIRREFTNLRKIYETLKCRFFSQDGAVFDTLSMGMTGDYRIAVECGSTMVRVGSYIFGERDHTP